MTGWITLSFLTALFSISKDIVCKKGLSGKPDEYLISFGVSIFTIPLCLFFLLYSGIPEIKPGFFYPLISGTVLNVAATVFYMKALRFSEMSLVLPMISFSPLFMLLTSPLIVGEFPDSRGIAGIFLIAAGTWLLFSENFSFSGLFLPFRSLFSNRGCRYMALTSLIWSISANIDKVGIRHSSPAFWAFSVLFMISFFLLLLMVVFSRKSLQAFSGNMKPLVFSGFFHALMLICQMNALTQTLVAYVIAIKRTSVVFGVIAGYFFFGEKLHNRLYGSILMFLGVLIIVLSSQP